MTSKIFSKNGSGPLFICFTHLPLTFVFLINALFFSTQGHTETVNQCYNFLNPINNVITMPRFKNRFSVSEIVYFEHLIKENDLPQTVYELNRQLDYILNKIHKNDPHQTLMPNGKYIELLWFTRALIFKIQQLTFPDENRFELSSFPLIEKYVFLSIKFAEIELYSNLKIALANLKIFLDAHPNHKQAQKLLDESYAKWIEMLM